MKMQRPRHELDDALLKSFSTIDLDSSVPVYTQIENHVRFAIASGRLPAGSQLPSVRELSELLGVNPNTVAKSYRDFEVLGILFTRRGMGVFVAEGVEKRCQEESRERIAARMYEVACEAKAAGLNDRECAAILKRCLAGGGTPYSTPPADLLADVRSAK
jgi:GntR family transcriptional regulator